MKAFNYYQPTEIRFGCGRINEIGKVAARYGKCCLIVMGPTFQSVNPKYKKIIISLEKAGIKVSIFNKVMPNPTTEIVSQGAEEAKNLKADVVIGLGGGSSMDTAKAIAVEATHKGTAWDYLYSSNSQPSRKTLPIVAVPTTSGTGSQVTQVAVITNTGEKYKSAIYNSFIFPKVSIIDPELMLTMPEHVTASTGFDAFSHAFESYINPKGSLYTDLMALESLKIISKNLPVAVREAENLEARTMMAWADTLAGLCIANAGVTLPHGIAMAIGGIYPHVMHGEALASIYPAVMRYSYKSDVKKFAEIGRIFSKDLLYEKDEIAAAKSCKAIDNFIKNIGMDTCLNKLKIPKNELKALAEASLILPDYKNHPRIANVNDIYTLLKKSYKC